jgi:protein disulfide-isomerase A1
VYAVVVPGPFLTPRHRQSLPAVSEVTFANLEEFQKADKVVVIAYLSSATGAPAPEFSATADKHREDYLFGSTTDEEAIDAAGVKVPSIVVYRSFDEPKTEFPYPAHDATVEEIEDWLAELSIPLIDEVSGENYATYAASGKPLAYLFVDPTDSERETYVSALKPIATEHKAQLNFVWIDAIKFGDHAKALNLVEAKWPSFVIQDLAQQLKYPLSQDTPFSAEAISDFVKLFAAGKLAPELKSAPIPESQDESVVTVVGKQFDEIVFDDSKDVFIEFYATWCVFSIFWSRARW